MNQQKMIDIHTHLWRTPQIGRQALAGLNRNRTFFDWTGVVEDHLSTMAANNIAYCVALTVTPTREMRERAIQTRGSADTMDVDAGGLHLDNKLLDRLDRTNAWGCAVGQEHPQLLPFIHVDADLLADYQLANYVRNRQKEGAKGVKLLLGQTWFHGNDRRLWRMYEFMEGARMPLFSQSGGGGEPNPLTGHAWPRPGYFAEVLKDFPNLHIILAHALGGYRGTMTDARMLTENYENIWFDTTVAIPRIGSAPDYSPEKTVELIRSVGVDHVAFGTNFPIPQYDRKNDSDALAALPLTDEEKQKIFYGNGAKALFIEDAG